MSLPLTHKTKSCTAAWKTEEWGSFYAHTQKALQIVFKGEWGPVLVTILKTAGDGGDFSSFTCLFKRN